MKLISGMTIGALATALALSWTPGIGTLEAWLGMAGPLTVAVVGWALVERTWKRDPRALTGMQVTLFVAKMIFIGAYLGLIIGMGWVEPIPFAASFTGYFLAFYGIEAAALYRLLRKPGASGA
jgi:uncharacterized membrane protein